MKYILTLFVLVTTLLVRGQVKIVIATPTNITVAVVITNLPDPKPLPPTNRCDNSMVQATYEFAVADWYRRNGLTTNKWTAYKPQPPIIVRRGLSRTQQSLDESPGARFRRDRNE